MAKVIAFFNNKGGVGKTTTSCNVAAGFSQAMGKKVLYIDLDPQCNATLLMLGEDKVAETYWSKPDEHKTIREIVGPLLVDEPAINFDPDVVMKGGNRFGVDLIMGHPNLSEIEDRLGEAWVKVPGGDVGALRKTNWCSDLVDKLSPDYDYVLIDLGPSLGSLNRSALIASDYFVTPMSIDIFSIIGLKNISGWLDDWMKKYDRGVTNLAEVNAEYLRKYPIRQTVKIKQGCLGFTSQAYHARRNKDGEQRPTKAFESILSLFGLKFIEYLGGYCPASLQKNRLTLGVIPNMFSLAALAQQSSAPIRDLKASDGIFGAHYSQAKNYSIIFDSVAENIVRNMGDRQ
ncbi:ParA family protein [Pseudomonas sp. GW456-L15]|uniref:ParA family protein n=1 Tax=Pseudomonas sp. GW456-L15 TaxID=2751353 RepID=UPI001A925686|nr:AAA family ATPase [Pseudomonas sp. GW456-L15]